MEKSNNMLVSVCCITYNQVTYIRQCLEGFLMQKTNFKFEVIIHDDCSTDGTTDVIREYVEKYPDLIKPIFQEKNQYQNGCKRILATFVYPKVQGKYIALCEGDDYWIDPLKLQKQVDFLESHPDYSMCFHNAAVKNETNTVFELIHVENREYHIQELFDKWIAPTASLLIKNDVNKELPFDSRIINGDINVVLNACNHGRVYGMSDVMSVYRVQNNGLTLKRSRENPIGLALNYVGHYKALGRLYPQINKLAIRNITDVYISISLSLFKKNPLKSAIYFIRAICTSPSRVATRIVKYLR